MPTLNITKPELIWPGKYDENGNRLENRGVALPFQVVETIREGRATREPGRTLELFSFTKPNEQSEWRNKLIWGDNLLVMASLLEEFAGKVDLIYIDPPFATGADFSFTAEIGDGDLEILKDQSIIEEKAYRDTWGKGLSSYFNMLVPRLLLIRDLLKEGGSIYVHCDWHVSAFIKLILNECFGDDNFLNEIVWHYRRWPTKAPMYQRSHDTLFWYRKGSKVHKWNQQFQELSAATVKRFGGKKVRGETTKEVLNEESAGAPMRDVWDIPHVLGANPERVNYPTQKPEALLRTIVEGVSNPGDLVADFFCGSGTIAIAAEKIGRRWIIGDLSRWAIHTTRKRLLGIPDCKPFEILNLGKYERKYWQGVTFGDERPTEPNQAALAAYVRFILDLYHAQPVQSTHIHGRKGPALVHVGAVDAPVTISEINETLTECVALGQKELHVLGWEWEMGLHDPLTQQAQHEYGIRLRLLNIPREVMEKRAVECGDIRFFDLAYLDAAIMVVDMPSGRGKKIKVVLKDFVMPDTELIPDDVRAKIRKWSDYLDYWAVDWDFQHDTFMNQWQTYRTRQNRKLELESAPHEYTQPSRYQVLIKVVDIFGNDTSRLLLWEAT